MTTHTHSRRASWARLRTRAAEVINTNLMGEQPSFSVLLWAILAPSLAGLALALLLHLYLGLFG